MKALTVRISAALLVVLGLVGVPQPASAQTVCATAGAFSLGAPIREIILGMPVPGTNFNFGSTTVPGACPLSASGTIAGNCSLNAGSGATNTGHTFTFVGVGPELLITGNVIGVMTFTPHLFRNSCIEGARFFDAAGALVLL